MKKSKLVIKELERIAGQKSGMQGVIEGDYRKEDVQLSWSLFSDSVRRSIFFVTDCKAISQINAVNNKMLCNDLFGDKGTQKTVQNDSVLNAFEILWNLSNIAHLEDTKIDPELNEIAKKMNPEENLLRIKNEFIEVIPKLIERTLPGAFEGHKIIVPQKLYSNFFPERLLKTWEDFETALAFMLENLLLKAHIDRLTHIYKEHMKEAFKEFEESNEPEVKKPKKHKRRKKPKNGKEVGGQSTEKKCKIKSM